MAANKRRWTEKEDKLLLEEFQVQLARNDYDSSPAFGTPKRTWKLTVIYLDRPDRQSTHDQLGGDR